jgi:hypothetical protein
VSLKYYFSSVFASRRFGRQVRMPDIIRPVATLQSDTRATPWLGFQRPSAPEGAAVVSWCCLFEPINSKAKETVHP